MAQIVLIYIDANFWIYWFDERLPEHKHVLKTMRGAVYEGVVLNVITLMEVAHYFRHLPSSEFRKKIDRIQNLATLTLVSLDEDLARMAFKYLVKYAEVGVGGRDSVILATMKKVGIKRVASHDKVFRRIDSLEVVDPIPAVA